MERTGVSLGRLLSRRAAAGLLEEFAPLVPGTTIALVEADGRVFVDASCPTEEEPPRPTAERRPPPAEFSLPFQIAGETLGTLVATGPELDRPGVETALRLLHHILTLLLDRALERRSLAQETLERYREINLLYKIGETISACLDPDEIPHLVLAEAARVIRADLGGVLLLDEQEELTIRSGFGPERQLDTLCTVASPFLTLSLQDGLPGILTAAQLTAQAAPVETALCAPLKTRERVLGCIVLGRWEGQPVFTAGDEKLLMALAGQAAIAVENARLFADVKQQRDAIAAIKIYMDNIFDSIASGVITTDVEDLITTLNRAAERILGVKAEETMGRRYREALPEVGSKIAPLIDIVKLQDESVVGYELNPVLPRRGPVVLRLHLSPLKDNQQNTTGIAIVADDLTEHRQLEEQVRQVRETFEQYVAPRVVEQLLSDPTSIRLGGVRQEVTTLYADIRGYTTFSERVEPEVQIEVLNQHLTRAAEAVLAEEGTLDKFEGDSVMALFNAPLPQPDHVLRAVRAALALQRAIAEMHAGLPRGERLSFGIGITTGQAVVGNIGSPSVHSYTAVGDSVNLASRLQEHAQQGQILIDAAAHERVREQVIARERGYVRVRGHSEPLLAFEVLGLRE